MLFSNIQKAFCIFSFFCSVSLNAEIRMAYSDLIPEKLNEVLRESFKPLDEALSSSMPVLSIHKSGSLPMLEDFMSDRLDICIFALPEGADYFNFNDVNLIQIPFCYKTSVVVVNAENPISEISLNQLGRIFGESSTSSNYINWRDFGISSFSTSIIKAYAVKEDYGISADLFRFKVLEDKDFRSSLIFEDYSDVESMIIQDKAAVGIFPSNPKSSNLKVLFISEDSSSEIQL